MWTAGAWCELRGDFRSFRADRMNAVELLGERFEDEPGKDPQAYLDCLRARARDKGDDRRARRDRTPS